MAEQIQINALIRPDLDTGGIVKKVSSIQALLKKVNLPPSLQKEFDGLFTDFNSSIEKINGQFSKGFETKGAVKSLDSMSAEMRGTVEKIAQAWQQVSSRGDLIKLPPDQDKKLKQINIEIQQLRTKINQVNPNALEQVTQAIDQLKGKAGQRTGSEVMELIDQGEAQRAINLLDIIIAKREKMSLTAAESKAGDTFRADTLALTQMRDALLNAETETKDLVTQLEQLDADGAKILTQAMDSFNKEIKETKTDTESLNQGLENTEHSMRSAAQGAQEMSSEMDEIKNRIKYFFSLANAVQLVRQALRQTFEAAKELDAAMTETAVVTNFSVGDMWDMLPEYTKTAQELGATTQGVYETLTLFYQQGLDTNEAMALGVETLKMARIAGMDYEEATSKMTAALRGFNMELNELSAQRVNDVYSELAAITAADTDQIATAMTKTASIANSANMEFETTAAFLSQIIETTQESAETAGTAMKTVIARFTELKKDPSLIGEVDGEVIDANKIETALNSIGVALRDNLTGQFRDLDDVFLDIAQKWEGLDTNTQRYIATIAAGSRQQSRFIAMMSDYERTMQLVNAANDSAGSSQAQFDKTLESMEAKLNQLKNTWQEFTLGLMDSSLLKLGIDALNGLLSVINKLTDAPGILGSASKAFLSFFLLFTGKKLFNVFEGVLSSQIKSFQSGGKIAALTWGQSFSQEFKKTKVGIQKNFKGLFSFTGKDGKALTSFIPKGAAKQFNDLAVAQEKANQSTSLLNKAMIKYGVTSDQLENLETANITTTERRVLTQLKLRSAFDSNDASQAKEILEQTGVAKAYDLSNDQMMEYLGIKKLGVSTDLAAAAAKAGVTMAQLKENAATALGIPLDRELTAEEEKQLAVEMRNQLLREQGILVRLKEKAIKLGSTAITKLETAATNANTTSKIANWLAQKLLNKEMLAGTLIIAAIIAAIALLVVGIIALVKAYQNWTKEGTTAAQLSLSAANEAKEAAQAYDDLKNSIENLKGLESTLSGLEKGTAEWKKTVGELNQQVLELLKVYPFLSKYISNDKGYLQISQEGYDELLNYQANTVSQKNAYANARQIAEQRIKTEHQEDDFSKLLQKGYDDIILKAESNFVKGSERYTKETGRAGEEKTTEGTRDATYFGNISNNEIEKLIQKYLQTGSLSQQDVKSYLFNNLIPTEFSAGPDGYSYDTEAIDEIISQITVLANEYDILIDASRLLGEQLITNANDLSEYSDTEVKLITNLMSEEISNRKWMTTGLFGGEKEVTKWNDAVVWESYQEMLEAQDSTYEYEITNKKGGNATVTRTKNGITEYQTESGEWSQEKQVNKVSQKQTFETVKAYNQGLFTEEDNKKINTFLQNLDKVSPELRNAAEKLVESGQYTGDMQKWFDKEGNVTEEFTKAIEQSKELFGNLEIFEQNVQQQQTIAKSEGALDSSTQALGQLAEGGKIENETALLATLGQVEGLYNNLGSAAEEWTVVSNQGIIAQMDYLTKLSQQQQNNRNQAIKDAQAQRQEILELIKLAEENGTEKVSFDTDGDGEKELVTIKELKKTLEATDWVLDIKVIDNFDQVETQVDSLISSFEGITKATEGLQEGFTLSADSADALSEAFPGILKNATVAFDGTITLSEEQRRVALETAETEIRANADAQKAIIKQEIAKLQGFIDRKTLELSVVETVLREGTEANAAAMLADLANEGQFSQEMAQYESDRVQTHENALGVQGDNFFAEKEYELGLQDDAGVEMAKAYSADVQANADAANIKTSDQAGFFEKLGVAIQKFFAGDFSGAWAAITGTTASGGKVYYNPDGSTFSDDDMKDRFGKDFEIVKDADGNLDSKKTLENYFNQEYGALEQARTQLLRQEDNLIEIDAAANSAIDKLRNPGGKDSGSSGSDKEDKWEYERDYDENIKSKLAAAENEKERLETELEGLINDENASTEDIINKKLQIAKAAEKQLALLKQQHKLDLAEVNKLQNQHKEWSNLYSIGENGEITWNKEAINALGLSPEQGEIFDEWSEQLTTAVENSAASGNDIVAKINEIDEILSVIYNEYDELYNIELRLNQLAEERTKLETEYNRILSEGIKNAKPLVENLRKQYDNLEEQKQTAQNKKALADLKMSAFLGREGNQQYQKYLVKDEETGRYTVNVAEMEKLATSGVEEAYEPVAEFIENFMALQEDAIAAGEEVLDIEEEYLDLLEESKEAVGELEQTYYDAIIEYMDHQIEETEELYSTIDESNSRILDSINESLERQRQERQNAETESDINDMRNRLAYLQMDTSGANQQEIMNLQKSIQEKEEDYTDTLIDQKIDELERQNDIAAEQRERQINLLKYTHEEAQKNGTYLQKAQQALSNVTNGLPGIVSNIDTGNTAFNKMFPAGNSIDEIMKKNLLSEGKMPTRTELVDQDQRNLELIAQTIAGVEEGQKNLTAEDARLIERLAIGLEDENALSAYDFTVYDLNGDGMIGAEDAMAALKISVGLHSGIKGKKFATGGLADYTGPAWLDGTKSRPELVLNQQDTQNFLRLRDVLSQFMSNNNFKDKSSENSGDNYYEIHLNVEKITSDYDVEQLANKVKLIIAEDANSRGVNSIYRRR